MPLAAKEEILSTSSDPCVLFPLAAFEGVGENSRLGSARKNPAPHQGSAWSNSGTALGIEPALRLEGIRSRSTGKERDSESGLDNFEARYNSSNLGRFMSADQLGPGQHPGNPQSWNLYSYVLNNPLKLVDPSGEFTCDAKTVSDQQCDHFQEALDKAQDAADKLGEKYGWDSKQYTDAQRAIDAYGDEGVDNGVTIAQGNVGSDTAATLVSGSTVAKTADNPNGQNIRVVFDKASNFLGGDINRLAVESAHEGVHVADGSDWVNSGFSANANPSLFQTEQDAYRVGNNVAYGLGVVSLDYTWGKHVYTIPLPLSQYGLDLTDVMIKRQYPLYNLDAFSKNTKMTRFQ
jgi:RHS repeat-associated protein